MAHAPRDIGDRVGWPGVRLWLLDLSEAPAAERAACLTETERQRAARFAFAHDRRRYLAAHVQLHELLQAQRQAHVPGAPRDIAFTVGPQGKPRLAGAAAPHFNLSHCADAGVLALGGAAELGVDLERLRPVDDLDALARRCFTPGEQHELAAAQTTERDRLFLQGWTRKEACLKAIGSGLSLEPAEFHAGLAAEDLAVTLHWDGREWTLELRSFAVDGWIGAIARIRTTG